MTYPTIIQGGMGIAVSNWQLARAVSQMGQMGVVSGTALDSVFARRLQLGDIGGNLRRALDHFPVAEIAQRVYDQYFIPGGKSIQKAFKRIPMYTLSPSRALQELAVTANFAEVFLAKEGHDGVVGINYLEKVQMPNLASIYGAMLAGVDYVLMGAGIPREIPGVLYRFSVHEEASLRIHVAEVDSGEEHRMRFDPKAIIGALTKPLKRPNFLAIISSATLAITLAKKSTGKVDGFIVEGHCAGGHNAPPRGAAQYNDLGEPIYGERDETDLEKVRALGLPFWLAGSFDCPERVQDALREGAKGVQVGTLFAFCEESGLAPEYKRRVLEQARLGLAEVRTDAKASPTGFPFKVAQLEGTLSDQDVYEQRVRVCDLGYLRTPYKDNEGAIRYRCPSEPEEDHARKGGDATNLAGYKCLCNALLSNIGLAQIQRNGDEEKPLLTAGLNINAIARYIDDETLSYSAADVVRDLLGESANQSVAELAHASHASETV